MLLTTLQGWTALLLAVQQTHADAISLLLEKGADANVCDASVSHDLTGQGQVKLKTATT